MVERLIVDLKERSYPILFEESFMSLPEVLKKISLSSKLLIIADSNVDQYYGEQLENLLRSSGLETYRHTFEAGEQNKTLETVSSIYHSCLKYKLDRSSVIIALGGGVTGDIAGFAAASYMRGIRFVQVPTSLLAQVDSSVGGKVGVDYKGTKNVIGAFHQPVLVYMNLNTLQTLPKREFKSGLAEIIKHGIIYDEAFFDYLEEKMEQILALDMRILKQVVQKNCAIKAQVVQEDEKEQGLRAILNFGHTIGHGIESVLNFSLLHGECVAIGMNAAAYIAYKKNYLAQSHYERIVGLLQKAGLPVQVKQIDTAAVYNEILQDKKRVNNKLKFILPKKIGQVVQTTEVTEEEIFHALGYINNA